ncbi:iron transporter [Campylobacter sp. JMF_01 NE2]|uniref:iron transporter n=1 Tax=unclassified Campylobacter TaxID=2593542 RepID=UPI0022E9EECE|nr:MULTISPECIES: iron transporter [unclassified Campylobacter]MDA3043818.1 iron transporter [Campylobacter sp. JMF_09 ED2]MDA3045274.1 iron transporter [Campylobacter sp. JMF_07 ED4]MDA3047128.1 iron transporter [Campylobacter sp. VBCF_06 NA8]MDA3048031.1 iron transporter [Campylobacter sp. JMF_08 NE1]MDA3053661.1 iron transporter [Campylobacter sp. JMF_03 NE3]
MKKLFSSVLALSLASSIAFAGEQPIGEPVEMNGMEIAAVYLQPIDMEPKGIDLAPSLADIHLEADIHAIEGNANGFGEGEWIPYLKIGYELKNLDNGKIQKGNFMPMVASDGPHYGANVKMENGVGNYELIFHIENPGANGFGRHADKATGVGKWWGAFDVKYTFAYTGTPKE